VAVLARLAAVVSSRGIESDTDLGPLLDPAVIDDAAVLLRLRQMHEAGAWVVRESAVADLPSDLRWLFESNAVNIDQLAQLHGAFGVTAAVDLADILRRGVLRATPGLDGECADSIATVLPRLRQGVRRLSLGRATLTVEPILETIRREADVEWAEPAGSLRRGQETVGDVELVVATSDPGRVFDAVVARVDVARTLHRSARRLYILTDGVQVGIRCPDPAVAGAAFLQWTGSHAHLDRLVDRAQSRGWSFSPEGLDRRDGRPPIGRTEEEIYAALDLHWVPAEVRNGNIELRAAETGVIPALIGRRDIRGDLHMHSTYSDGRDEMEAMVQACVALGYEYMAITDHSPHAAASRNLTPDGVRRQADEIAALRERYPQIAILHGCEVDILPDGRLDFNDRVLERFDIVLASLHDGARQSPGQLLGRYLAAMRHPLVTVITHPSNRLVPGRSGYELDYDLLFAAAVETGTMVEVDGGPAHLDLDGALAYRAVLAGAMLVVDSDSHRADALERQMEFGVRTARRGWVEPRHVMNTRPLEELRSIIAGKRSRQQR
jgi:DNA polymerase (family 10)